MANLRFFHDVNFPTSDIKQGMVYFSSASHTIAVGTAEGTLEKYYGGNVSDAKFENNMLTISLFAGNSITLDFSDVASKDGVQSLFSTLRDDINNLQAVTGVEDGAAAVSYDDSNYLGEVSTLKEADEALDAAIKGVSDKIGNVSVANQIKNAIEGLDSTASQAAGADGLALKVDIADGMLTSISGSIAENTYDKYGAADEVLGSDSDAASDYTVYGAMKAAKAADAKIGTEIDKLNADKTSSEVDGITVQVVESKGIVTSVVVNSTLKSDLIGKADGDDADDKDDDTIEGAKRYADYKVNTLNLSQVGTDGSYVKLVSQSKGKISATAVPFDTTIGAASSSNAPTSDAVKNYVNSAVADLNGAMHFIGAVDAAPTADSKKTDGSDYKSGDVVFVSASKKEYVFDGSSWIELGDESMVGSAIAGLDATVDNGDAQTDGIKVTIVEADGILTSVNVDSNIKSALIGGETDAKDADTIFGAKAFATDAANSAKTAVLGGSTGTLKAAEDKITALETKVGDTSVAAQITAAINGLDAEKSNTAAQSGETASTQIKVTVSESEGLISSVSVLAPTFEVAGAAGDALKDAKDYADGLKATIDAYTINGEAISGNPVLDASDINVKEDVAEGEDKETIAAALTRIENSISNKNVSAEGDGTFIAASAANNKVTVTGTYASVSAEKGEGTVASNGIVKGSDMKSYVDGMFEWVNF